jgi:hypothetical protein
MWMVRNPEKFVEDCCIVYDADPSGQYLLGVVPKWQKAGIYEVSISDRKCVAVLPGVVTFNVTFARDGKSFLYAVPSRAEITIFRQAWRDGQTHGDTSSGFEGALHFSPRIRFR